MVRVLRVWIGDDEDPAMGLIATIHEGCDILFVIDLLRFGYSHIVVVTYWVCRTALGIWRGGRWLGHHPTLGGIPIPTRGVGLPDILGSRSRYSSKKK